MGLIRIISYQFAARTVVFQLYRVIIKNQMMDENTRYSYEKPSNTKARKVKYVPQMDPFEHYYNLTESKGLAIIFYHTQIPGNTRLNSEYDAERFENCFKKFNFNVEKYKDCKFAEISNVIKKVSNLASSTLSSLIIAVSTHGDENVLEAFDKQYKTRILWETFAGKLVGVPKMFFIDACRGDKVDHGVEVADGPTMKKEYIYKLPTMADFLFMFSSYEGHLAYDLDDGSYFMHALCNEIEKNYKDWDLLQILTFVNKKVAVDFQTNTSDYVELKVMPQVVTMLTKLFKFYMP